MKRFCTLCFIMTCAFIFSSIQPLFADNVKALMKSAERNYNAKNYSKALADLEWIRKEITNLQLQSMKKLLPSEIAGMKGVDADGGAVLGIHAVTRNYINSDRSRSVSISISSGKSSQAGQGLGAIMGMAASFGAMNAGTRSKMIISKGYRGQFSMDGNNTGTLIFNLNGGTVINIETRGFLDSSMAEKAANALNISKIEASF
ncbi:MAG: hypothetical protein CSB21_03925 [Deltaproteobacteria bacterium]|nr:MAG: hypothetical protein CSB21_03925 [Deltaproteobacteria bacterium]